METFKIFKLAKFNLDPWNISKPWAFGVICFTYLFAKNQHIFELSSFVSCDTPLQHFANFLAPASEAIHRNIEEMARDEVPTMRLEALGEDDAVELAKQYRTERQEERGAEQAARPRPSTMIVARKPINQVKPDNWHTKANKSTFTAEELEKVRRKYQIPAEIELKLPTSKERASNARPMEFTLYEEALRGGLRLSLLQIVVDVLKQLEVAPGQLMPNTWKILLACVISWSQAAGGAAMTVEEIFSCYKASSQQETWVTLQVVAGRGLVAGLPSSVKGWRPRWFFVSANGERGVHTTWKVPTKSVEPRLEAEAENRVK
ncbi:uncharacterized protein LOC114263132 [Camellia sinensis]|uniref:uncharacterized protein LOC114263132 n=1 Tax=Camellia sinensis TaxID=4442 RepID=UPI001036AC55|nr:uncharacterized protein LOC114263132 [Camellia sinensis]XP_028059425.1 uncharacterized protein LOC114263132 [Camellia sinensis]XP_028059426.1 uncharacterized protein LOC114263132 [Camellia sinensis]XP_028059427.1 uncharacterized protein LOC114263132 [Camellia sinensis]XP_028059428.1 uncharacterized protein LOC114263132 [Camellia sinensis]XP_028059429.1 uncharacterized protein LOC114263132 [Camellia sinensis]